MDRLLGIVQAQASKDSVFARLPQSFTQTFLHSLPNFLHPTADLSTVSREFAPHAQ